MIYVLLNGAGILLAGLLSGGARHWLKDRYIEPVLLIANLCILLVGIQGAIRTDNFVLLILSAVLGGLLGTLLDIEGRFKRLGDWLRGILVHFRDDQNFSQGFVTVFMLQVIGSMAIVGPIEAALNGDGSILVVKTVLDIISTLIYGMRYGRSVCLSAPFVVAYQSLFFLLAHWIAPFLTPEVINEIGAVGSLLIAALALSLLDIKQFKVANYLPAIFGPVVWLFIRSLFIS